MPSRAFAPSSPTSSATVISSSSGPWERLVLDESHHRRDRDTVVGAQRRAVGGQPVTVADEDDSSFGGIVRARRVALADHVQVALEDEDGRGLPAGSRGNTYDEVASGVLLELISVLAGPSSDVLDHRLFAARRTRDRGQLLEVPPERAGLEVSECRCRCHHDRFDPPTQPNPRCVSSLEGAWGLRRERAVDCTSHHSRTAPVHKLLRDRI